MNIILGVNAYHADASACLLRNGELVAAVEEERFKRIKHWAGLPIEAIRYCLSEAGISMRDVSIIAVNSNARASLYRKLWYTLAHRPDVRLMWDRFNSRTKRRFLPEAISTFLAEGKFSGRVHSVEHHLAHLASAFLVSPFQKAAMLSVDGFGDFVSTAWGMGEGNALGIDGRVHFPHSLGIFYETITRFLGFKNYGDEYKVMGLAPYGRPRYVRSMETLLRLEEKGRFTLNLDYFNHHTGIETFTWDDCAPKTGDHFTQALSELFGPPRAPTAEISERDKDIAHSVQVMYERAFFHLLHHLHETYPMDSLVLGGGCAFNSVANGKIYSRTPFKKLFVQAAAGDAGGALGAALYSWHVRSGQKRSFTMEHAYWGPSYSDEQIASLLSQRQEELANRGCQWERLELAPLIRRAATAIADGLVVGWFQGRMEWGPRALGNRSILCDPRRADIRDTLNAKIKRRESFRPLAPAVLREYVSDWFETDDDVPFMMKVFQIKKERRASIPAVTHIDGSGRLQTVEKQTNALYYRLIHAFHGLTGVPMLLNTSFNENEPIVCSLNDALHCFLRTRMDMLVLGNCVLVRDR